MALTSPREHGLLKVAAVLTSRACAVRELCSDGFFNACYGRDYSDLCYGFNVFWRRHAAVLGLDATSPQRSGGDGRLWGDGFEVETLIHVRVANAGLKVTEVPSFEHSRIHGVSNLNAFHDGRRVLRTILIERRRLHSQLPTGGPSSRSTTPPSVPELPAQVIQTFLPGSAAAPQPVVDPR